MYRDKSFGILVHRVIKNAKPRLELRSSISIEGLLDELKDETKRSGTFQVSPVVQGGDEKPLLQLLDPRLQY